MEHELNVFKGFFNNFLFIFVLLLTIGVQIALVEVGGMATKCYPLNWDQNLICIYFGSISLIWGLILNFMPLEWFQWISIDDKPMDQMEQGSTIVS